MSPGSDNLNNTRKRIQLAMQRIEADKASSSVKKRVDLAIAGVKAYEERRFADAVRSYLGYLRLLEEYKGVGEGGLVPGLFDAKSDIAEILMISGMFWDLAKLYDRTSGGSAYGEFVHYLDKFVLFGRGFPHQHVCAESLRKYLRKEKPNHSREFRQAYTALSNSRCFVVTELVDEIEDGTLESLRAFRDGKLAVSQPGRAFIALYYRIGPWIALALAGFPRGPRRAVARGLDRLARRLARSPES